MVKSNWLFSLLLMTVLAACSITKKYSQLPERLSIEKEKTEQYRFVLLEHNNLGADTKVSIKDESIIELLDSKIDAVLKTKQSGTKVPHPDAYQLVLYFKVKGKKKGLTELQIKGFLAPDQTPFLKTIALEVL